MEKNLLRPGEGNGAKKIKFDVFQNTFQLLRPFLRAPIFFLASLANKKKIPTIFSQFDAIRLKAYLSISFWKLIFFLFHANQIFFSHRLAVKMGIKKYARNQHFSFFFFFFLVGGATKISNNQKIEKKAKNGIARVPHCLRASSLNAKYFLRQSSREKNESIILLELLENRREKKWQKSAKSRRAYSEFAKPNRAAERGENYDRTPQNAAPTERT